MCLKCHGTKNYYGILLQVPEEGTYELPKCANCGTTCVQSPKVPAMAQDIYGALAER